MTAVERLLQIQEKFGKSANRLVAVELDEETLRVILYFKDDSNLRVTEQWDGEKLKRYSYYWLTSADKLKIGWDNAPHHRHLEQFPHHKHIERQENIQSSSEKCLEDVMKFILQEWSKL